MIQVAIIDYGVGNLRSVEKAFAASGVDAIVTSDEAVLRAAERLVLPGVGAFAACMNALKEHNLEDLVRERVADGVPLLGVCVGMQMLFDESDEFGGAQGLGLIAGKVKRFDDRLHVPQIGWNQIHLRGEHALLKDTPDDSFFYFVHSYFCAPEHQEDALAVTEYGENYASIVARENVCGVQFHPEKSQAAGLKILKNFAEMDVHRTDVL
ncbi:MAG: imidazole glycerol phosphate synthase subunit HisH [Pyrinomonadaceae bacterium MAG19_C2-C3]|nr:imidazole glycerol phosphate synthase subunit HisH [Pyrinomonadaceae bacterium MAG19_C2-C3]